MRMATLWYARPNYEAHRPTIALFHACGKSSERSPNHYVWNASVQRLSVPPCTVHSIFKLTRHVLFPAFSFWHKYILWNQNCIKCVPENLLVFIGPWSDHVRVRAHVIQCTVSHVLALKLHCSVIWEMYNTLDCCWAFASKMIGVKTHDDAFCPSSAPVCLIDISSA